MFATMYKTFIKEGKFQKYLNFILKTNSNQNTQKMSMNEKVLKKNKDSILKLQNISSF